MLRATMFIAQFQDSSMARDVADATPRQTERLIAGGTASSGRYARLVSGHAETAREEAQPRSNARPRAILRSLLDTRPAPRGQRGGRRSSLPARCGRLRGRTRGPRFGGARRAFRSTSTIVRPSRTSISMAAKTRVTGIGAVAWAPGWRVSESRDYVNAPAGLAGPQPPGLDRPAGRSRCLL